MVDVERAACAFYVNIHEAKDTRLAQLVDLAEVGEERILYSNGEPVAKLISYKPEKKTRRGGQWEGKV